MQPKSTPSKAATKFSAILFLAVSLGILPTQAAQNPTELQVFKEGKDTTLVDLTRLCYLIYDQADDFKMYKLMYGLTADKKKNLLKILDDTTKQYTQADGWTLNVLDIGKGMFLKNESSGGIILSKYDKATNTVMIDIAFRGTRDLDDWGTNLKSTKKPLVFKDTHIPSTEEHFKQGEVHQGNLSAYNTIAQDIGDRITALRADHKDAKFMIRIGGHSLGGTSATLCAAHLVILPAVEYDKRLNMIHLETYGSPRVLGVKLSKELTDVLGADNILRLVNKDAKGSKDMVPTLPFESMGMNKFKHVGDECTVTPGGDEIYEGFPKVKVLRTPHRIEGYQSSYRQNKCGK